MAKRSKMPASKSLRATRTRPTAKATRRLASAPKAGRPTAARREAIDAAIITAARELFLATGYENTPMDAIAATARVSKPTLYARYPTKEALHRAVVIQELARLDALSKNRWQRDKPKDLKRRLQRHARGIISSLISPEVRALKRLFGETIVAITDLAEILHAQERQTIQEVAADIAECTNDHRSPPADPVRVAEILLAALYGWHTHQGAKIPVSAEEALEYADQVVDIILGGRTSW